MNRLRRYSKHKSGKFWKAARHKLSAFIHARPTEDVLLLLVALQLAVLGVNWANNDNPILGLRLEGQLVGQLAGADFRSQADSIVNAHENETLNVKAAEETSQITLRQLGVKIDASQVYDELISEGRSGNPLDRLADQDLATFGLRNVRLGHPNFNSGLTREYIAALDKKIRHAPANAYFAYEQQKAMVKPDKPGRAIDEQAALDTLKRANPQREPEVVLPVKQVPADVTKSMLESLLPEVQAIARKPLLIAAGESRTTLNPEQLVGLVVPKIIPDASQPSNTAVSITFNEAKLNALTNEVVKQAVVSPKPTIISGGTVVQQGQSGVATEDDHPLAQVLAALVQRQTGSANPDKVDIPLVSVAPPTVHQVVQAPAITRTGTGLVRLTFDDGPGGYTGQILDILGRYNVHASFYVVGRNVPRYAGQMQRTVREGHKVCNHSYNHANLARLSHAGVQQELSSTQSAIQQVTGVTPNCFRPPYGAHNATVRSVAAGLGMSVDMWSVDPRDWAQPGSGAIRYRVLSATHSGAVVLLHVLDQQTVNALPGIIEGIRAQGYTLE